MSCCFLHFFTLSLCYCDCNYNQLSLGHGISNTVLTKLYLVDDNGNLRDQVGYVTFFYGVDGSSDKLSAYITLLNGYTFGDSFGGKGLASLYGSKTTPILGPYSFPFQKYVQTGLASCDFTNVDPVFCEQGSCTNSIFITLFTQVCGNGRPTRNPTPRPTRRPVPTTRSPTRRPVPTTRSPTQRPTSFPTSRPTKLPTTKSPTPRPTRAPTNRPTIRPTRDPTVRPTDKPTLTPTTRSPTNLPTIAPTKNPTKTPTKAPSPLPTSNPTKNPTRKPTKPPSKQPTENPTNRPTTPNPTKNPTVTPTKSPTKEPTETPTHSPTQKPLPPQTDAPTLNPTTKSPTRSPSDTPTINPSQPPSTNPTRNPTKRPTKAPSKQPTSSPTHAPSSKSPTKSPSNIPTKNPTKKPTRSPSKLPTHNPTKNPTTESPTKSPTSLPTKSPSNLPTIKPTPTPTPKRPTKSPTQFPTDQPSASPEVMPPTTRQRVLDFDSLDLFLIMDRSNSVTYYTAICEDAPTVDGVPRNCWKLNMNSAIELVQAIADDMGWADNCKPKPKCGLRVAAYAFACSSNQLNPITIPIIKELSGSEAEVIPPLQNAYENMNPNAGTCPERALENVVLQIEENWPTVTQRPYKSSIIFTDGILYNGQRNDDYPFKLSDAIRRLCGATFAFAVAVGSDQLSEEFKQIQQRDLLQLAGSAKTIIDLDNGQEAAFNVFVKTMNVIMNFVDNLPQCTTSRYVFDNPQCLFETKGVCESALYCKWINKHPVTNKVACVQKNFCTGFEKSQCDSDVFCVWSGLGCVAKSTLSQTLSCCCMDQARCDINNDRCVWKNNKCDSKIELRVPVIEE